MKSILTSLMGRFLTRKKRNKYRVL